MIGQYRLRAGQAHQFTPGDDQTEQFFVVRIAESQQDIAVGQRRSRARRLPAGRCLQPGVSFRREQVRGRPRLRYRPAHLVPALPQGACQRQERAYVPEVGAKFPGVKQFAHGVRCICPDSISRGIHCILFARPEPLR